MTPDAWSLIDNPAWAGKKPDGLVESACHDRSHCLTIACTCGEQMHVHETQIAGQEHAVIGAGCKGCSAVLEFPPGFLHGAFAEMRRQGWIR